MSKLKDRFVLWGILVAIFAGVFVGWKFPEGAQNLAFLGSLFFNALYLIIVPLIVASMIVGITALGDIRKLGRTARMAIMYFMATSAVAVIIGIILAVVLQPGITGDTMAVANSGSSLGFSGMLVQIGGALQHVLNEMIPRNIIAAAAETKVLALIVFSLFFGGILSAMGSKAKPVIQFFEVFNEAIMKLVHMVMYLAPFGVFGIVASKVGEKAGDLASSAVSIGMFSLVVVLGLLLHAVILTLALKYLAGRNPWTYLLNMGQALSTAVGVSSSSATLPVTMECVVEKNKVDHRAASFVLPLGTTINMDGTAMYQAISTIFVCQLFGISLGIEHYVIMFITAILASVGAPGLPQAGIVMMTMVMGSVGVSPEIIGQGIGIILVVDWALDRGRTALNIYGDSVGAAVIANTFEFKTAVTQRRSPAKRDSGSDSSRDRSSSRRSSESSRGSRTDKSGDNKSKRRSQSREFVERPSPEGFGAAQAAPSRREAPAKKEAPAKRESSARKERVQRSGPLTEAEIQSESDFYASMVKGPVFDLSLFETMESDFTPSSRSSAPSADSPSSQSSSSDSSSSDSSNAVSHTDDMQSESHSDDSGESYFPSASEVVEEEVTPSGFESVEVVSGGAQSDFKSDEPMQADVTFVGDPIERAPEEAPEESSEEAPEESSEESPEESSEEVTEDHASESSEDDTPDASPDSESDSTSSFGRSPRRGG